MQDSLFSDYARGRARILPKHYKPFILLALLGSVFGLGVGREVSRPETEKARPREDAPARALF